MDETLSEDNRRIIRNIVRHEVENVVRSHLVSLTDAVLAPMADMLAEILRNQKLISDGQTLVEKHLASQLPDDDEPSWDSLGEDA